MPSRSPRLALLATAACLVATPAVPAAGAGPTATAAATCSVGSGRHMGPTYLLRLSVRGTSCRTGKRVVRAFYGCRVRHGGADGRCRSRVLGFRCSERRSSAIRTQFDARVSCAKGSARVSHSYTQFT